MISTVADNFMALLAIRDTKKTFPTGDPKFAVQQAFPAGFDSVESDPFLMCDIFGPSISQGKTIDEDEFPVNWHPHRGMDIMTYLVEGVGRHADSLGNRGEYRTPGFQWISVGSGIEHAEAGGTPAGQSQMGFQIWINVPSQNKMDDPRYGVEEPESIPLFQYEGGKCRLLAGPAPLSTSNDNLFGPFKTIQSVQIIDFVVEPQQSLYHSIPESHDNCLLLAYSGEGSINNSLIQKHQVMRLDSSDPSKRVFVLAAGDKGMSVMLFSGKRLNESIAWHGPFVMNTDAEIKTALTEYRNGTFLKQRVAWDYKRIATKPAVNNEF